MRRSGHHDRFPLFVVGHDITRADAGDFGNKVVELRRAVVLPQVAEICADDDRSDLARRVCKPALSERFVNFDDVSSGDEVGADVPRRCDDGVGGLCVIALAAPCEREEDCRNAWPLAFGFGCASSRCSASNISAARFDVNDLRSRLPLRSRQSA